MRGINIVLITKATSRNAERKNLNHFLFEKEKCKTSCPT